MDVGRRIYDLRYRNNLTAKELGDAIGVSQSYISLLENNKRRLNMQLLTKIAEHFGLSLAQFFSEEPAQPTAPDGGTGVDLDGLVRSGKLRAVADAGGNVIPVSVRLIPVVSKEAAGDPAGLADGEFPAGFAEEFVPAPADLEDPSAFAVRIQGDRMSPRFRDRDVVICSPKLPPENGDAVVAKVRGEKTTCMILYVDDTDVILSPVNPGYPAQVYQMGKVDWFYPVVICQRREKR